MSTTAAFSAQSSTGLSSSPIGGLRARREQSRSRGRLRGRGLSVYLEWTGALPTETVDIGSAADGTVTVFFRTQAMGRGWKPRIRSSCRSTGNLSRENHIVRATPTWRTRRQRRIALRVRGRSASWRRAARPLRAARSCRGGARDGAGRHRVRDGDFQDCRHDRPSGWAELAARQPEKGSGIGYRDALDAFLAQRRPGLRSRDRTRDRRGPAREHRQLRRHRPDHNHMIVEGQIQGGVGQGVARPCTSRRLRSGQRAAAFRRSFMDLLRAARRPAGLRCAAHFDEKRACRTNLLGVKAAASSARSAPYRRSCTRSSMRFTSGLCCTWRCRSRSEKVWRAYAERKCYIDRLDEARSCEGSCAGESRAFKLSARVLAAVHALLLSACRDSGMRGRPSIAPGLITARLAPPQALPAAPAVRRRRRYRQARFETRAATRAGRPGRSSIRHPPWP